MLNIAINGFGRIGRVVLRVIQANYQKKVRVAAINTSGSMDVAGWANFLKHDSVYGQLNKEVKVLPPRLASEIGRIKVGKEEYPILAQRNPAKISWKDYKVNTVLECTGAFCDRKAEKHFSGGAKKVIISAPAKDSSIPTYILGVNAKHYKGEKLISNGSCTTNCVALVVKVMEEEFGFLEAMMTTIHAYTASQELTDGSSHDWCRGRAAAYNLVPTGTGAAKSVVAAYPRIAGRFAASAIRVPVICGSYSTFVFKVKRGTTINEVNQIFEEKAKKSLKDLLTVSYESLVSSDIVGNSASAILDAAFTKVISDDLVYLAAWYDNEWGYACRLVEMAIKIK